MTRLPLKYLVLLIAVLPSCDKKDTQDRTLPHERTVSSQPTSAPVTLHRIRIRLVSFTQFPGRYRCGDWEHEVRLATTRAEVSVSAYELLIRYRGKVVTPGGHCDFVRTPWGAARSLGGRWIPPGCSLGGRFEMLSLTSDELARGKDITPPGASVEQANRPTKQDRLTDCLLALEHPARWVRMDAARHLGRLGPEGKGGVEKIAEMLKTAGPDSHEIVMLVTLIEALGRIGPDARSAMSLIKQFSRHRDPNVRAATIWAVTRITDFETDAQPFCAGMLGDPDESVRAAAKSAMAHIREKNPPPEPVNKP